jgi:hypothetical protein
MNSNLESINNQMMLTAPQANINISVENVNKSLADAEAKLATADKTNLNQYVSIMQQVLMLRQRKTALTSTTHEQLLAQKVTILEELINNPAPTS